MDPKQAVVNEVVQTPDITSNSNGADLNSPIKNDPVAVKAGNSENKSEVSHNFTIQIYRNLKISIYKPLIPLKLALFLWYAGGGVFTTFYVVFLKQRGITLGELSTVHFLTPIFQFLGPTLSGIIADKIGRSKPVLVVNILFVVSVVIGLFFAPSLNVNCDPQPIDLKCHPQEFGGLVEGTKCDVNMDFIELVSCNVTCPEKATEYCDGQSLICELLEGNENVDNFSLSVYVNWAYELKSKCYYNVTAMSHKNITYYWCNVPHEMYCKISCLTNTDEDCSDGNIDRTKTLILYMILMILFPTFLSNSYRFMDVTAMSLVKDHNSDFGRERLFAVFGVLIFNPLIGYIIDETTVEGTGKNYDIAFFFFFSFAVLFLIVIYKLEVRIKPPGENMWKKSFHLLKNPDVIAFILVLTVIGSAWNFAKNYTSWYLEGMNAPSFLLGLLTAASALYGLPFLFTSNWWVKKIGTTQIFILGLLGYVASGIGYSLLYNPWLALLIEATNIVTYHLLWVAVIVHSHRIAPDGLTATIISIAGGIHYSLGKGFGGSGGGQIMNHFGGRIAYRVMAIVCLIVAVLYSIYLYIRRRHSTGSLTLDVIDGHKNDIYDSEDVSKEETYLTHSNF